MNSTDEPISPAPSSRALYLRLLRYVAPHWRMFALSIGAMVVSAATEPALPALMKPWLDGTFVEKDRSLTTLAPIVIVLLVFLRGLAGYVSQYAIGWVGNRVVLDLRRQMFGKLVALPTRYFDDHPGGALISKITFDVTQVTQAATNVVTVSVRDSIILAGLLGYLVWINWKLTLITLTVVPLIGYIIGKFSRRLRAMSRHTQLAMGDITQVLEEAIDGQRVVKVFGGQAYEAERFERASERVRRFNMKQVMAASANIPLVQVVAAFAVAFIIFLATRGSEVDRTSVGGFVSFIVAMLMLMPPLKRLTGVSEALQRGLAAAESVFELTDVAAEPDTGIVSMARAAGRLDFDGVELRYGDEGEPALSSIHLSIEPGETVALVGPSGSGKTTLVHLIPRFYSPTRGRVLLDGVDLLDIRLESLRNNIALVSQDVVLFNDTVAANIAYGRLATTPREKIVAAAEAAHAMEFIEAMPQGLDTVIGENGVKLSGGQRQRLAIARAILKDAPVLILDEATSALDSASERHVQGALDALMRNRTTIVIAHRLSTVENADRIVVLQRGRIVESGTHAELIRGGGIYRELHKIQFVTTESAPHRVS
jgi:ATP-binding cassette, subfamily B, bacterial MsbA